MSLYASLLKNSFHMITLRQCHSAATKVLWWVSHLLLLVIWVIVRRLVRRCREVVRSIALMVHHIQATHSDGPKRLRTRESEERNAHKTAEGDSPWDFRRAGSSEPSVPLYMPKRIQWPCRPVCIQTMRLPLCAPPAPTGATKSSKTLWHKHCMRKKTPHWQVFRPLLIGWAFLSPFSLFFCFGRELYLERAGAIYARPLGKGLQSAMEFSKALWV